MIFRKNHNNFLKSKLKNGDKGVTIIVLYV